jgi:hypothetical protein
MGNSVPQDKMPEFDGPVLWGCRACGSYSRSPTAPVRCTDCGRRHTMILVDAYGLKPIPAPGQPAAAGNAAPATMWARPTS